MYIRLVFVIGHKKCSRIPGTWYVSMNNRSSVFCSFDRFCKKYERKQNGAIENNTPTKQNETKNNKTTKQQNNKTKQNETKRKQNKTRKTQQEQEQEQEKGKEKKKRNTQDTTRQNAPPYVLAHLPFNATQRNATHPRRCTSKLAAARRTSTSPQPWSSSTP